jgi:hypothetical protein
MLATPAWRGEDRLGELLAHWSAATNADSSACLYLLCDPRVDGSAEEIEARVLATGVDLRDAGDITVLIESVDAGGEWTLHAGVDAYVPLHGACEGHVRLARAAGRPVLSLDGDDLPRLLGAGSEYGCGSYVKLKEL